MSADFWGVCPCCYEEDPGDAIERRDAREDFEIGLDGNPLGSAQIRMIYKVRCTRCGAHAEMDTSLTMRRPNLAAASDDMVFAGLPHQYRARDGATGWCQCGLPAEAKVHHTG